MKATKKHLATLERIRYDLKRGIAYLQGSNVVGIAHATNSPNGSNYTVRNNEFYTPEHVAVMSKVCGSHIVGIYRALERLDEVIEAVS